LWLPSIILWIIAVKCNLNCICIDIKNLDVASNLQLQTFFRNPAWKTECLLTKAPTLTTYGMSISCKYFDKLSNWLLT
jgi:hypothetical protein